MKTFEQGALAKRSARSVSRQVRARTPLSSHRVLPVARAQRWQGNTNHAKFNLSESRRMKLSEDAKKRIVEALTAKGVNKPCPRCGRNEFTLLNGYFVHPLQPELGNYVLGGDSVPTVITACTNCGYIAQHALGALGIKPKDQ
jgi:hypothetical protein